MGDARSESERLPWLDTPRAPVSRPAATPRRKLPRGPIYILLSLFLLASVGVMSFLVGRGSVPIEPTAAPSPQGPANAPARTVTLPPPAPVQPAPAPVAEQAKSSPAPRAAPARKTVVRRKASRTLPPRSALEITRMAQEPAPRPVPVARRIIYSPPPMAARSGQVIQLGAFATARQADDSWRRLVRVYPYLSSLPKVVAPTRPPPGYARLYRLQLGTRSNRDARALCRNLMRIGRGCIVV